MAQINLEPINTTISGPPEINIPLIRKDHAETQNIFRVIFEVYLSISSTVAGYIFTLPTWTGIHWAILVITISSTILFLILSVCYPFQNLKPIFVAGGAGVKRVWNKVTFMEK